MLGRAGDGGIAGVEIHLVRVGHVARHHAALEEVDVLAGIDHARGVVQILQRRLAVLARVDIDHVHRRPGGAEIQLRTAQVHVVARVLAAERDVTRGDGERVLDQRTREVQPPVAVDPAPGGDCLDAGGNGLRQADVLEHVERRVVHPHDIDIGERLEAPAGHARPNRALIGRLWRGPQRLARLTPAHAPTLHCLFAHDLLQGWKSRRPIIGAGDPLTSARTTSTSPLTTPLIRPRRLASVAAPGRHRNRDERAPVGAAPVSGRRREGASRNFSKPS